MKAAAAIILSGLAVGPVAAQYDSEGNVVVGDRMDIAVPNAPMIPAVGIQVFDNEADFLAAAGALTTQDFEAEATIGDCDSGSVGVIDFGPFRVEGATPSGLDPLKVLDMPCSGMHNTTPGGMKYLAGDSDVAFRNTEMDFEFDDTICAFGLYITDAEQGIDINVNGTIYNVPATGDGGEGYFGIIDSTPFVTVELRVAVGSDSAYGVDDVSYGCPECFLVIGDGFGDDSFFPAIHSFDTQVGSVEAWYGTLMESLPEFVLPQTQSHLGANALGHGPDGQQVSTPWPTWMADGDFTVQVVMWNPGVFPSLPEQFSHALYVRVQPDGSVVTRPFGSGTGIEIQAEVDIDAEGRPIVRFPFIIPGL